jgi:predicted CXXCH cytochrome family protein
MAFRLRTIEFTADGRRIVRDRDVETASLTIGRSAENDIHLPDLAVEPAHATLEDRGGGELHAAATGTLGFTVDGRTVRAAEIDGGKGAELRFGSYRIAVSLDTDRTPLLTIEQAEGTTDELDEKRGFSLAGSLPGKRPMSWLLALLVAGLFLALPIASSLMRDPVKKQTVAGDASWSTGKLSLAHHALEGSCESCHVRPFEAVRDETCQSCHKDVHGHAPGARLAVAMGEPPMGGKLLRSVAHAFGKPGPGACTDCHTEHEGPTRMEPARQAMCADCHGTLDRRLPDTRLGNAADFGKLHPQFSPAVAGSAKRVSLDTDPREDPGFAFSHKLHLDKLGGVARMAASIGAERDYGSSGLVCANCHRPSEDGVRFGKVDMERDCEGCHSLAYDRVGGIFRRLRHGDVDQMVADLSVARAENPVVTGRRRPGRYAAQGAYYADFRRPASGMGLARRALSRDGICGECHTPDFSGGRMSVMPVSQVTRYMAHGWFDHKPHKQESCTSCHAAEKSASSSDLLLPGIAQCRTCHLGETASAAKVPSSCAMCHSYHPTGQAPMSAWNKKL